MNLGITIKRHHYRLLLIEKLLIKMFLQHIHTSWWRDVAKKVIHDNVRCHGNFVTEWIVPVRTCVN